MSLHRFPHAAIFLSVIIATLNDVYWAEVWWATPHRAESVTPSQLRLIRMRRCGPRFTLPLPESLYRVAMRLVIGAWSSRALRTKGEAEKLLAVFEYLDSDLLRRYRAFRARELAVVTCERCGRALLLPPGWVVRCEACGSLLASSS